MSSNLPAGWSRSARAYLGAVLHAADIGPNAEDRILKALDPYLSDAHPFDVASALYWFGSEYHGGQWSEGYAVLCATEYTPGAIERGPEPDSVSEMMYQALVGMLEAQA